MLAPLALYPDSLLSQIVLTEARRLLETVDSGMVPKLEACIRAVEQGVPQAHVIDGRAAHSLLLEVFTDERIGTMVLPDPAKRTVEKPIGDTVENAVRLKMN